MPDLHFIHETANLTWSQTNKTLTFTHKSDNLQPSIIVDQSYGIAFLEVNPITGATGLYTGLNVSVDSATTVPPLLIGLGAAVYPGNTASTIADARGIEAVLQQYGAGGTVTLGVALRTVIANSGGTMTSGVGVHVDLPVLSGGAVVTNLYGLKIENQALGTNNWAIKTGTGRLDFGAKVEATAYAAAGSDGIDASITTASLVGKTITVTKGIITGFA